MGRVVAIARHDLLQVWSDRGAVVWLILMPVVFATFFGLVMRGGASPSDLRARLTVVDEDGGSVAAMVIEALASERLSLVHVQPEAKEATPDKVRTLVIPAGLSEAVLAGERAVVRLERDPDSSAEAELVAKARIVAALATVLGRLVEASAASAAGSEAPVTPEALAALPAAEEPVVVDSRFAGEARVVPGGFAQSIPGNAVMFVLLVALTYGAASISAERAGGQLRRLVTTPAGRGEIVAGKILGRLAGAGVQITVLMAVAVAARATLGIEVGDNLGATWVVLLVYGLAVAPLGIALGAFVIDPDRAASIGVIVTMAMAAFGGCWWPLEVVSGPLQTVALALPTGWAMAALHGTISFGRGLDGVLVPLLVLVAFGFVFSWIAARSLRLD